APAPCASSVRGLTALVGREGDAGGALRPRPEGRAVPAQLRGLRGRRRRRGRVGAPRRADTLGPVMLDKDLGASLRAAVDAAFEVEQVPLLQRLVDLPSHTYARDDVEIAAAALDE